MKRLIALIGVALLLVGIRLYDTGITRATDGVLTVFAKTEYSPDLFLPTGADCYRIDLDGMVDIDALLEKCMATIRFVEQDGEIIYAYSHKIPRSEWIHGKRVNIMIYAGESKTILGVPIIKGSY